LVAVVRTGVVRRHTHTYIVLAITAFLRLWRRRWIKVLTVAHDAEILLLHTQSTVHMSVGCIEARNKFYQHHRYNIPLFIVGLITDSRIALRYK
jgi:ABC-type sulfate/molybdate transport systems ATPase subunit